MRKWHLHNYLLRCLSRLWWCYDIYIRWRIVNMQNCYIRKIQMKMSLVKCRPFLQTSKCWITWILTYSFLIDAISEKILVHIHVLIIQILALSYNSPNWHRGPLQAPLHQLSFLFPSSQPLGHSPVVSLQLRPWAQWHGYVQDESLPNRQPSGYKM